MENSLVSYSSANNPRGAGASPDSQAGTECASQGGLLLRPHRTARYRAVVLALDDSQLALVMTAAGSLPVEKRSVFLERVAARLQLRGPRFTDADLGAAIQAALKGLIQSAA